MSDAVRMELDEAGTRVRVELRHPKGNLVTAEMLRGLRECLSEVAGRPRVRLLTIEGAGRDFSFGAAIEEHRPELIGEVLPEIRQVVEKLLAAPAPTAAIVRGRCLGGGFELALACDLIFAAEDAVFGLPEVKLGVFPPIAAILLPARVGLARATRAMLTGEARSATYWRAAGLITAVAPAARLDNVVRHWFNRHLAAASASGLRYVAAAARQELRSAVARRLPALERLYLDRLMTTHDAVEGVTAFLEKRRPNWQDR